MSVLWILASTFQPSSKSLSNADTRCDLCLDT